MPFDFDQDSLRPQAVPFAGQGGCGAEGRDRQPAGEQAHRRQGSDNPGGRALDRRVEIVIPN
jgi:hypothetical protein